MGLPWVRLDTQMPTNPKVLDLVAAYAKLAGLKQNQTGDTVPPNREERGGQHGTDGFIPETALPFIHATRKDADVHPVSG
jgi:hypothetical protein